MKRDTETAVELTAAWQRIRPAFRGVLLFSFVVNALVLMPAIYMMQVYDRVLTSRNLTTLLVLTLITVFLYGLMSLLEWVRGKLLVRLAVVFENALRERVFTAAFQAVLGRVGGDARQALNDLAELRQFAGGRGLIALLDAPWAPVFLVILFLLHPVLGWLGVFGVVVLVGLTWLTERRTQKPLSEASRAAQLATGFATNQLANSEVIQAMGMLPALRQRWVGRHLQAVALHSSASDAAAGLASTTRFVRMVLQSAVLGVGAWLVIADGLSGGGMIAASILMGRALAPIEGLIGSWKNLVASRDAWGRLDALLRLCPARPDGMRLAAPKGQYQLEGVFAVPPGGQQAVLRNINLQLPAGECLAVIGPSGSGKSSLVRLLVGVWPARQGTVRLDGADLYQWDKAELGPHLGYLPQDVELFEGTVAENIARFGEVDAESVMAASKLAGIHELVLRLPQGYDTPIGPGGGLLSGGQRQRVGLARALYRDPQVIVLDEPNSNLDDAGEAALLQAVVQLKARRATVVVVTHRKNMLPQVDRLLLLADGEIKGYGPRDRVLELMQKEVQK
ncbi:MAG: hypothetical protein RL026_376 [Pseudomonadota bacterium]